MTLVLKRDDVPRYTVFADDCDENERGARYMEFLLNTKILPTDQILVKGFANFGNRYPFKIPAANYEGDLNTRWSNHIQIDENADKPRGTPAFLLPKVSSFKTMRFFSNCPVPNEDGGLIGWNEGMDASVRFSGVTLEGGRNCDWVFYNWTPGKKVVIFENQSRVMFCRQGIALCDSGSPTDQTLYINDVKFMGSGDQSNSIGDSSDGAKEQAPICPIVMRGGVAELRNMVTSVLGLTKPYAHDPAYGPVRAVGLITDTYGDPGQPCTINIMPGCRSKVQKGITKEAWDVYSTMSKVNIYREEGIGPHGEFLVGGKA